MKSDSKSVQYTLLAVVILIWGGIGYRAYRYLKRDLPDDVVMGRENIDVQTEQSYKDTYTLKLNYADPFLGGQVERKNTYPSMERRTAGAAKQPRKKQVEDSNTAQPTAALGTLQKLPTVLFTGYSLNETAVVRARLSINGQGLTLRQGEMKDGLELVQLTKDSVLLRYGSQAFTVKRKAY